MGTGRLVVTRDDPRDIKIRNLEVWIDGSHAADLKFGERYEGRLEAGEHVVRATNRLSSRELTVSVKEGGSVALQAANRVGFVGGAMMALVGVGPYRVELSRVR